MIKYVPDSFYITIRCYNKDSLLTELNRILKDGYIAVITNNYLNIFNSDGKILQWRRAYKPRSEYLIPIHLLNL